MEVCKAVERVLKARYERIRAVAADAKDDSILGSRQICSHQDLMSLLVALSHLPHGMDQGLYALAWSIAGIQFPDATLSYQHAEKIRQSPLPAPRVVKNMLERTGKRINGKRIPNAHQRMIRGPCAFRRIFETCRVCRARRWLSWKLCLVRERRRGSCTHVSFVAFSRRPLLRRRWRRKKVTSKKWKRFLTIHTGILPGSPHLFVLEKN